MGLHTDRIRARPTANPEPESGPDPGQTARQTARQTMSIAPKGGRRLVIFDVDGTLIDSQAYILAAMRAAFEVNGLAPPDDAATLAIVGLSLPEAIGQLHPDFPAGSNDHLVESYKAQFVRLRREMGGEAAAPMYPGARAALEAIHARGVLMACATGKARRGLDHAWTAHDIGHFFAAGQTADDAPSKPAPGMVLNCLAATGVDPRDAVMVGDTSFDAEMARAAGVASIGVSWGYHPVEALHRAGVRTVLDSFEELLPALDALWEAA